MLRWIENNDLLPEKTQSGGETFNIVGTSGFVPIITQCYILFVQSTAPRNGRDDVFITS